MARRAAEPSGRCSSGTSGTLGNVVLRARFLGGPGEPWYYWPEGEAVWGAGGLRGGGGLGVRAGPAVSPVRVLRVRAACGASGVWGGGAERAGQAGSEQGTPGMGDWACAEGAGGSGAESGWGPTPAEGAVGLGDG